MKIRLLFFAILICTSVSGQDFIMKMKLADRYYERFDYHQAIPMYEQLLKSYPRNYALYEKLADSYRKINDYVHELQSYAFLVDTTSPKHEYLLYYAQALAANKKYDESVIWYKKYEKAEPSDTRGKAFSIAYEHMYSFYKDSTAYFIKKMPFCTEAAEFSPAYFGNGLVYVSNRSQYSMIRIRYNWTYSAYLDLYYSSPDSSHASLFSNELNSMYHEGPVTFSKNQDTIIFTRSNYYHNHFHTSNEGVNKLKLYQANWNKTTGKWENITSLPFNNNEYSVGHPALSPDGSKLYFASDMPGGYGGVDLYVSHRFIDSTGHPSWSKPENLGSKINSPGNEVFPYIDNLGNLWFASNGLPGLGGLDVFIARKNGDGFDNPVNPGYPFNTCYDDFGYITKNSGKDGYISSNRYNTYGNDDIFLVKRLSHEIILWVYDAKSKKGIPDAAVEVNPGGGDSQSLASDINGFSSLTVRPLKSYQFAVSKEDYLENKLDLLPDRLNGLDTLKLPLAKKTVHIQLNGSVFSADNKNPFSGASAVLINKTDGTKMETSTDASGVFHFDLQSNADYEVKVAITTPGSKCSSSDVERSTKGIDKDVVFNETFPVFCVGDVIKVENIYYDLGKYNIRPDAAKELDKLLDIMNRYPKMKIELRSHTDSRGTAASNLTLSDNRAKAAAEYLYSKGVARDRIIGKGYGETMLLNQCAKGVKCSEEDHKINRRTEFKILSVE